MLIAPKLNANVKSNWRVVAMPDRLPSLVLLVGFWLDPSRDSWFCGGRSRSSNHHACSSGADLRPADDFRRGLRCGLVSFSARPDSAVRTRRHKWIQRTHHSQAVAGLAVVSSALVLPGSVLACMLVSHSRGQWLRRTSAARVPT